MLGHVEAATGTLELEHGRALPERPGAHSPTACTGTSRACTRDVARRARARRCAREPDARERSASTRGPSTTRCCAAAGMLGEPFHYRDERTARGRRGGARASCRSTSSTAATACSSCRSTRCTSSRPSGSRGCLDARRLAAAHPRPDRVPAHRRAASPSARTRRRPGSLGVDTGEWDDELIERLGLPASRLPAARRPRRRRSARCGPRSRPSSARRAALEVVAVGSHDTASAVVAVPMRRRVGRLHLVRHLGARRRRARAPGARRDAAREANFTNEGGVDGRVRFLHNVMGLWLLSESVRAWERGRRAIDLPSCSRPRHPSTAPVAGVRRERPAVPGARRHARRASPSGAREHGAPVPRHAAPSSRASIIESLAAGVRRRGAHARARSRASTSTTIHIVGGGALNELLCQAHGRPRPGCRCSPDRSRRPRSATCSCRPARRASRGRDLESLRALVAAAFAPRRYEPRT